MRIPWDRVFTKFKIMKYLRLSIALIAMLFITNSMDAQDFVYKPINPAFGGDTFNYQWLLNSAQTQNLLDDPDAVDPFAQGSTLDDFSESLNRQLLSQLSRQLVASEFGEDGLQDGNYTLGNFQINVESTLDGVAITIYDNAVGEQTQIIIPFF